MQIGLCVPNFRVFICTHVRDFERDIRLIYYDEEGDLAMLCGEDDHDFSNAESVSIVGLAHLWDRHPGIKKLSLIKGFEAVLDRNDEWVVGPMQREG